MANLHVTLIRRRPDSRVPMRILKSKHLCTVSGGLSPGRNTLSYHHHRRLSICITCVTRVCRNNLIHFSGATMLTNPGRPFHFPFITLDCLGSPTLFLLLPSLPGIRVNRVYRMERMVNMEEGFENVWRCLEEYTCAYSKYIFIFRAPLTPLVYCYRTGS